MVLFPAVKKFSRHSMSQEDHMIVNLARQNSIKKDTDSIWADDDHKAYAASVAVSHSNGSPKQKIHPSDPTRVTGLHPQGNEMENQGAEVGKDSSNPPPEASKSPNEDEKEEKSIDKSDLQESPVKFVPCNDKEESDAMEQDVKVCDICGDTGREDLLAICFRCTDGAEHTYCMREMLHKVPEGDWLCEECKFAEECTAQKSGGVVHGKDSVKAMQVLAKRPAEEIGVACKMKKQALEVSAGSPRLSNLSGTAASSQNSSLNMEKRRAAHDISEIPRFPNPSRIEVSKNTLLKSKSFNALTAKSKVKQVEEGFWQKPRGARHHSLLDTKMGSSRTLGKSSSFKYINRAGPDSPDSKFKIFPAKFPDIQEFNGGSEEKNEQNPADRNRLPRAYQDYPGATRSSSTSYTPKLDQKLSSRSETHSLSSLSDSQDSNIIQSDNIPGSLPSKTAGYVVRQGTDGTVGAAGPSSSDDVRNVSVKKRSNRVCPKGGMPSCLSWSSEKPCNNGNGNVQDGLGRAPQSRNCVEKTQESFTNRSGKTVISGSRTVLCGKCDEAGHTAEFCSHGSSQACEIDVSALKIVRGDMHYASKSTVAVTSAMLKKPGIYRKNKRLDKSDNSAVLNGPAIQERMTPWDILKKYENVTQLDGMNEAIHSPKAGASESKRKPVFRELPAVWKVSMIPAHECIWQYASQTFISFEFLQGHFLILFFSFPSWFYFKFSWFFRFWSFLSLFLVLLKCLNSVISLLGRGGFQVQRDSKQMELHGGFQAHLPTFVSPMVLEMVTEFPDEIALNEVPRLSTWPVQFHGHGTKEDHIALYFFARDLESYERNYRVLLESMMKSDLALKADLGSAELLIFPSNQLPEKSQRWNMSFYLWGIFKGSRANSLDHGLGDGENSIKKQKTDYVGTSACNGCGDANLFKTGLARQVHDLSDRSAIAEIISSDDCDNGVTVKGKKAAERYLFPVNSEELKTADSPIPWNSVSSVEDEVRCHVAVPVPDLELALGAETKSPNKGICFWVDQSKPSSSDTRALIPKENEEVDRSTSLSLSLSFPFSDEE